MKTKVVIMAMALMIVLMIAAEVMAGKTSATTNYWRVTDIQDTHFNGLLIQREVRFSQSQYPDEDIFIIFFPNDPAWQDIKKIQIGDWFWLNIGPGNLVVVIFGLTPPAQTELGNIID